MIPKRKILVQATVLFLLGLLIILNPVKTCQRFEPADILFIDTDTIEVLGDRSYRFHGSILNIGKESITQHGFCWSEIRNPTLNGSETKLGSVDEKTTFSSMVSDMEASKTFYVRAYVTTRAGTEYGKELSFTTDVLLVPSVATTVVSNIASTTATSGGDVTSARGLEITARGVCWSTMENPTLSDNHTTDSLGLGKFNSAISGLSPTTEYFIRAYATDSLGTVYGNQESFTTQVAGETVTDYDGNVYNTVQIGDQLWMAQNLMVTTYPDGESIPLVEEEGSWSGLAFEDDAYCWYDNSLSNKYIYGGLYTWKAAMHGATSSDGNPSGVQGVCPDEWHLPSEAEWKELEMFLGMSIEAVDSIGWRGTDEGGKLKQSGIVHWGSPNTGATNESGFSALPGGYRSGDGIFRWIKLVSLFWSASEAYESQLLVRQLSFALSKVARGINSDDDGFSVRCIKDGAPPSLPIVTTTVISNITQTGAQSGGEITNDKGLPILERGVCWSTSQNPMISDNITTDGTEAGSFTSNIAGLSMVTKYYVRAYATNSNGTAYGEEISFISGWDNSTVTDYDGNIYYTVQIGEQVWLTRNLSVTHYADGTPIPLEENESSWAGQDSASKAYCWYDNNIGNINTFGALYTWAAATRGDSSKLNPSGLQGACPDGWHLPSDEEWKVSEMYLGMTRAEADQIGFRGTSIGGWMKEEGAGVGEHWSLPNEGATNETGFTALGGGIRDADGKFSFIGGVAPFWSSTQYSDLQAWARALYAANSQIERAIFSKRNGFGIRCTRD